MARRSRAGPGKSRRRKPAAPKRASRAEAARPRSSSAAGAESEIARLAHDLNDALERETAASEILNIISSAQAASVQPVLDTVASNAAKLCRALNATIYLREDDSAVVHARYGPPGLSQIGTWRPINRDWVAGAAILDARPIQVADLLNSDDYPAGRELARQLGHRTTLAVPLLQERTALGVIVATRREVYPFSKTQIALLQNFAAQAVIAIENARLLSELRQRTADLSESLDQQTATSEVLKVISSSRGELEPVFQAMLEKAVSICDAKFGTLFRFDGSAFQMAARVNTPAALAEFQKQRGPFLPPSGSNLDRMMKTKQVQHSADDTAEPVPAQGARLGGARSIVHIPMLQGDQLVGALVIYRQEVRPFTEKHIELLKNFAAQAVIAIENARLLSELRQRTADLSESLEQQTATADVLSIISSSPGELEPVFQAILNKAVRICEAKFGHLVLAEGDLFRLATEADTPSALAEHLKRRIEPTPGSHLDRVRRTKQVSSTDDDAAEPVQGLAAKYGGARSMIAVPMLKDQDLVGVILIFRQEVRPFTDKQISLVQNFAAQAVIAIENARLLNELRESLEQQTATSEVLKVISRSAFHLQTVLDTLVESAMRLCRADNVVIFLRDGENYRLTANYGYSSEYEDFMRRHPIVPGRSTIAGRTVLERKPVHVLDVQDDPDYTMIEAQRLGGFRTMLGVPLMRDTAPIGVMTLLRNTVQPFSESQTDLATTFSDQAVIAIENARLLNDLNNLNQQLEARVADQVGEIERMGRLRRFLPPQVADLIVAAGTEKQLESHRREITALFCDLRGFTGFSESSDPEDVMALLADYHAAIGTIINKYSGTLERYAGDGVMVIFNDPVPVENPALQAVLMALEMRTAIGTLIERWRDLGHDLGFGIGIAHGFATLGTIGFEGRRDYAAIGTVSNVASRLCDDAKPGQILISPRVRQAVEKAVSLEQVGEFAFKGIRRPTMAYNVLGPVALQ